MRDTLYCLRKIRASRFSRDNNMTNSSQRAASHIWHQAGSEISRGKCVAVAVRIGPSGLDSFAPRCIGMANDTRDALPQAPDIVELKLAIEQP